jgi:hypothetical protein
MSRKPKPYPTVASASRETGISPATLRKWRDVEKIDILDPTAVEKRAAKKQLRVSGSAPTDGTQESYQEARRRREVAAANRLEVIAARERGELTEAAAIAAEGYAIGLQIRHSLDRLAHELSPQLAGHDSAKIMKILKASFRTALEHLADSHEVITSKTSKP